MAEQVTAIDPVSTVSGSEAQRGHAPCTSDILPSCDCSRVQAEAALSLSRPLMDAIKKDISRQGFSLHRTLDRTVLVEPLSALVTLANGEVLSSGYSIMVNWDRNTSNRRSLDVIIDLNGAVVSSRFAQWRAGELTEEQPAPRSLVQGVVSGLEKAPEQEWVGRSVQSRPN